MLTREERGLVRADMRVVFWMKIVSWAEQNLRDAKNVYIYWLAQNERAKREKTHQGPVTTDEEGEDEFFG